MTKNLLTLSCIFAIAVFFTACGGEGEESETKDVSNDTEVPEDTKEKIDKTKKIIAGVPSPVEITYLMKRAGAKYDYRVLNDVKNVSKYVSTKSKAINLGIYGADMNYATIFEETSETMYYLSCVRRLMEEIGINNVIDVSTIERIENNVNIKDTVLEIASETFSALDMYLAENNRQNITALVIAGGWIEGMHVATSIIDQGTGNTDEIRARIAEQKLGLTELISLIETYESDDLVEDVLADLKELEVAYKDITIDHKNAAPSTDESGSVVLGGTTEINMTDEQLQQLTKAVNKIRNKYISA
jgi:methyl-accepting chemotaxis protein